MSDSPQPTPNQHGSAEYNPSTPPASGKGDPSPGTAGEAPAAARPPKMPRVDVREHGATKAGAEQVMDRRLFMQLLVFRLAEEAAPNGLLSDLGKAFEARQVAHVLYEDVNDPRGIAVLTWSEDPSHFVTQVRPVLADRAFQALRLRPEMTMIGRTYSSGHEHDLVYWLLDKPQRNVMADDARFGVWYPLRRNGAFAQLDPKEQASVLREHALIGRAYGESGLAHDVRLACHGLDASDNEFVIGLIGKDLHPLSHVVQRMRSTRQTSEFISQMGPFFVGHVARRWTPASEG